MKKNNPLVTVIMSVYNSEYFLKKSINSILNQTYKNLEFIIVNDGSNDQSLKIIKSYMKKDSRIVLINQRNIGLTKSLNKAIKLAKGKYIARQDADDESFSKRILTQIRLINKFNLDLVVSRALKNKKNVPHVFLLNFNKEAVLKTGNLFIHGTFCCKKEVFQQIKYHERFKYAQDFKFLTDCLKNNIKIGYIKDALYKINIAKNSISNTKKNEQAEYILRSINDYFDDDKYFLILKKTGGILQKILRIIFLIFLQLFSKKKAFKIIG